MKSFEYLMKFSVTADNQNEADRQIAAIDRAVRGEGAKIVSLAPEPAKKGVAMSADVVPSNAPMTPERRAELGL